MKDRPSNLPASVLARLRDIAREKETDYQLILRRYAIERLLHRLSISPHRDQFVLKGAMLFTAWLEDAFRPTQDLDLLGFGDPAVVAMRAVFEAICQIEAEDEGLVFDTDGLSVEPIREDQQYGGVRVKRQHFSEGPESLCRSTSALATPLHRRRRNWSSRRFFQPRVLD